MDIIDYYTSLDASQREKEAYLLKTLTSHNIIPESIRFDEENTVIKSINRKYYFFKDLNTENIAEVTENDFVSKSYPFGCDLIKAPGQSGGGAGGKPGTGANGIPSLEEEDDVQAQQGDIITDRHPSGVVGTTPDLPERGRIWHEDQLVRSEDLERLNDLSKSLDNIVGQFRRYSDKEKEYMLTHMGKTPQEVESGNVKMSPTQKILYQKWLGKSLRDKINKLQKSF